MLKTYRPPGLHERDSRMKAIVTPSPLDTLRSAAALPTA